ncbi:hypothetical protein BD410DRAFT_729499 [Rickenella mellea]|uniref:Protein YAE1 n=1 Tax=Rickenella mellea TaxID=50990 RepID=A0A4Y7PQQ4_9AGAM|nr:hypothetical protein BD410DRAFT_729499 [Rickenella mellea]
MAELIDSNILDLQSPWEDDLVLEEQSAREWSRLSEHFVNAGYREGITAGKESTLQEGFDSGFSTVGAPLGREVGMLRGATAGLSSFLRSSRQVALEEHERQAVILEVLDIENQLHRIQFSDIEPRDLEAEEHAQLHRQTGEEDTDVGAEIREEMDIEKLQKSFKNLSTSSDSHTPQAKLSREELTALTERVHKALATADIDLPNWS